LSSNCHKNHRKVIFILLNSTKQSENTIMLLNVYSRTPVYLKAKAVSLVFAFEG